MGIFDRFHDTKDIRKKEMELQNLKQKRLEEEKRAKVHEEINMEKQKISNLRKKQSSGSSSFGSGLMKQVNSPGLQGFFRNAATVNPMTAGRSGKSMGFGSGFSQGMGYNKPVKRKHKVKRKVSRNKGKTIVIKV